MIFAHIYIYIYTIQLYHFAKMDYPPRGHSKVQSPGQLPCQEKTRSVCIQYVDVCVWIISNIHMYICTCKYLLWYNIYRYRCRYRYVGIDMYIMICVYMYIHILAPRKVEQSWTADKFFYQKTSQLFGSIRNKSEHQWLVGGWPTPLKNMKVSRDYNYSQYIEK